MEVTSCSWWLCVLFLVIIYKIVDRLIRIPTIGHYGKYVFITGCDTGFGNLLAKRLDDKGINVFAGCFTEKGETELRKACSSRLVTVPLDVTKHESVVKAYELVKERLPTGKGLWGLVNNAGISGLMAPMEFLNLDKYKSVMDVNAFGMVDMATTFLPLVKQDHGRFVFMTSMLGRSALVNLTGYSMTKFAMEGFASAMRRQMRMFGVGVHILEPEGFRTGPGIDDELQTAILSKVWERLDSDTRREYGEDFVQRFSTLMYKDLKHKVSSKLYLVIDAYEHALFGRFPRARYVVGIGSKIVIAMEALPEWISDVILNVISGAEKVLPATLLKRA